MEPGDAGASGAQDFEETSRGLFYFPSSAPAAPWPQRPSVSVVAPQPQIVVHTQPIDIRRYMQLQEAFARHDVGRCNALDVGSLAAVMAEVGSPVDPASLELFFRVFDTDKDGRISFAEFMSIFVRQPQAVVPAAPPPRPAPTVQGTPPWPQDGKFVDLEFPPVAASVFASPDPGRDHLQDILRNTQGGRIGFKRVGDLCLGGQLFNNVHPNDIAQGVLGDCWLLAGVAGLAEFEGMIFQLFENKALAPDGQYAMRLYNMVAQQWERVVVDDYIPTDAVNFQPIMARPQDHEAWVLLVEKAVAKWFGSYAQINGAYCLVPYMLLTDCGPCRAFSQNSVPGFFDTENYRVQRAALHRPHDRFSVAIEDTGRCTAEELWAELAEGSRRNYPMSAWTVKDPPQQAGVGASGEAIASDGIVKGHAYSVLDIQEKSADGRSWRLVRLRNPWGKNPNAEWKGALSDNWPQWALYPELKRELDIGNADLDGMFWMPWDDFRARFSDIGVAPKSMEVPRLADIEGQRSRGLGPPAGRHVKKFRKPRACAE